MKRTKFTETKIVGILKEYEAGKRTEDICREQKINRATFYTWRKKVRRHGQPAAETA